MSCRSEGGTRTSRGVAARSRIVPSTSSRIAHSRRFGIKDGATMFIIISRIASPLQVGRQVIDWMWIYWMCSIRCGLFGEDLSDEAERSADRFERLSLGGDSPAPFNH